ncbi:uncharacterized protein LOC144085767 isoform X2 [Stigmatopora argus]
MPRRLPYLRGNLSHTLQRLHTHVKRSKKAKQKVLKKSNKGLCSRPRIFLQRNLRQCGKVLAEKETKRNQKKRPRKDSRGSRITRKKRHLGSSPPQDESENWSSQSSFHSTCGDLAVEGFNVEKSIAENDKNFTTKIKPKLFPQNSECGGKAPKLKGPKKKTPAEKDLAPFFINGVCVERVQSFKFLGVHVTDKLSWSTNTMAVVKKAQKAAVESTLADRITACYAGSTDADRKAMQRVINTAQKIIGCSLPSLDDIASHRYLSRAVNIARDPWSQPVPPAALWQMLQVSQNTDT